MRINDPEIVAELQALYQQYEKALVTNDTETLTGMFWASPQAMRFGIAENLYGIDEIDAFRRGLATANLAVSRWNSSAMWAGKSYGAGRARFGCVCQRAGELWQRTCPFCPEATSRAHFNPR
jgi:hypothetical protein